MEFAELKATRSRRFMMDDRLALHKTWGGPFCWPSVWLDWDFSYPEHGCWAGVRLGPEIPSPVVYWVAQYRQCM